MSVPELQLVEIRDGECQPTRASLGSPTQQLEILRLGQVPAGEGRSVLVLVVWAYRGLTYQFAVYYVQGFGLGPIWTFLGDGSTSRHVEAVRRVPAVLHAGLHHLNQERSHPTFITVDFVLDSDTDIGLALQSIVIQLANV